MSTNDKIELLKSVPLFADLSEDFLKQIAATVKEKEMGMGEIVVQKDEIARDMYIIVSGRFRVHDNNIHIKELGEGDFFGELAALSFTRRVASVSALSDGLLLKISSPALYELIQGNIELAKAIIKALCVRMESMALQLQRDKKQHEQELKQVASRHNEKGQS
ncbi:MAG: cyclic nucleotide-binding domain-containing protein [Legionella sp.]|nr:MAG: cyclic nucleotide-binding domain-containing protein [Legionella sp.]